MVLTLLVIVFAPRQYQSTAKLLLKPGRENVSVDPTVTTTGDMVSLHRTYASEVNTAIETMASLEILDMLVDNVGSSAILRGSLKESKREKGTISRFKSSLKAWVAMLDPIDDRERAILELKGSLKISAAKDSSVVNVTYTSKTPELAQRVTQSWVELYRSHHAEINSTKGSLDFFLAQEAETSAALQKARETVQSCKSRYRIVTVDGEQQTLESQIRWGRSNLAQLNSTLVAAKARLQSLLAQRQTTDKIVVTGEAKTDTNEAQDRMRDRLYLLEIDEKRIASLYSESHPNYIAAMQQLKEARELFEKQKSQSAQVTQSINPVLQTIEEQIALETANIQSMQASVAAVTKILEDLSIESTLLNERENEIASIQREVDILEIQYRNHVQNREQARIASELEAKSISNVNIFQPASLEFRPVSPNKKLCGLMGLVGSLMAAFGFAMFKESIRVTRMLDASSTDHISDDPEVWRPSFATTYAGSECNVAAASIGGVQTASEALRRTVDGDSQRRASVPR